MRKIIDCFLFYNELQMLNYRLNILKDLVDYFLIVESTHTFVGKEKKLYFNNNQDKFNFCKDKIIHIIVDDMPYKYPNTNYINNEQWQNEYHQRNCIKRGLEQIKLVDDDLIIITDLDEIPNPNILNFLKFNNHKFDILTLEMDLYYYNLNTMFKNKWLAARILTYKKYKDLNISCEQIRHYTSPKLENGGWHLSYFGDSNFISNKIQNFAHQELNNTNFTNIENIQKRINNFSDLYDRNYDLIRIKTSENTNLPYQYDIYLKNFILE
jgi:beta-1,4-mannosyl-glycoprotein beta-1,4-N-acetylglucosaminyltransferase